MHVNIFTLFPEMFGCYLGASILERVQAMGLLDVSVHNIRDFAHDRHRVTDEPPYGGGGGMILKPEPIFEAVESVTGPDREQRGPVILLTPQGRLFTQTVAEELAAHRQLNLIAGRYEGVDERVRSYLVTDELSVGDYVLTGGELAAMVVVDAVARLLPGALGAEGAADSDSHATGLLEGPHYTRPAVFRGWEVPAILRSGHGANITRWRREEALRRTWLRRPELLLSAPLDQDDRYFLATLAEESVRAAM
jgi:tRNA (guanine37-N1)-methyltransferase